MREAENIPAEILRPDLTCSVHVYSSPLHNLLTKNNFSRSDYTHKNLIFLAVREMNPQCNMNKKEPPTVLTPSFETKHIKTKYAHFEL